MKKLSSSLAARITPVAFLLTTIVALALWLGSAPVGLADAPQVSYYSGAAPNILTTNCNTGSTNPLLNGLCQPAPACNNGAGPNPLPGTGITASVSLCETRVGNGSGGQVGVLLRGTGSGKGFQFGKTYISLAYFNGNTHTCSRFRDGVPATLQNLPQGDSDFGSMMLGFWVVDQNGNGTLTVNKQATVTGLQNYGSVSVREIQPPNTACYDCGNDPAPQFNALRACGALTVTQGTQAQCLISCACDPF